MQSREESDKSLFQTSFFDLLSPITILEDFFTIFDQSSSMLMLNSWINLNLWKAEKGNKLPKGPPTFLNHSASLELSSLTDKLFLPPPPPLPTCWLLIITSQQSEQHIFHLCGAHSNYEAFSGLRSIFKFVFEKKVMIKGRKVLSNFDDAKSMS